MTGQAARGPSMRQRWLAVGLALLLGPLLAEIGLRWLLFGTGELAQSIGAGLRKPALFARAKADDRLWILRNLMDPELLERYEQGLELDPHFGWRNEWLVPPDYEHPLLDLIEDRAPVPFYGASFVRSTLSAGLHLRPLGAKYALLPYGVGGFGMGQALAVARRTLPAFEGRAPLVLLGVQLEADPHRALLGFRAAAKPRAALDAEGKLVLEPFDAAHTREHVTHHPLGIRSYVLAWLFGPASPLPGVRDAQNQRLERDLDRAARVNEAIVIEFDRHAEAIGGELGVLLFHEPNALNPGLSENDQRLEHDFVRFLEEHEVRYVNTRRLLEREIAAGNGLEKFYEPFETAAGLHPSLEGYSLFLEGIETLLEGGTDRAADGAAPPAGR